MYSTRNKQYGAQNEHQAANGKASQLEYFWLLYCTKSALDFKQQKQMVDILYLLYSKVRKQSWRTLYLFPLWSKTTRCSTRRDTGARTHFKCNLIGHNIKTCLKKQELSHTPLWHWFQVRGK